MFAPALIAEINRLDSDHPLGFLAELQPGTGPIERVTNQRQDITFHGNVFTSRPFLLQQYGEGTAESPQVLQAVFGNANLFMSSLVENYWRGVRLPQWFVTAWLVDMVTPNNTPLGQNARFRITQIRLDDVAGAVTMREDTVSTTQNARMRRFTTFDGFPTMRQRS